MQQQFILVKRLATIEQESDRCIIIIIIRILESYF